MQVVTKAGQAVIEIGDAEWAALNALNSLPNNQHFVCATGVTEQAISNLIILGFADGTADMARITQSGRQAFSIALKREK